MDPLFGGELADACVPTIITLDQSVAQAPNSDLMRARAQQRSAGDPSCPPSFSVHLVTSSTTLANGQPISLPASWGGGNSPSGTGSRRAVWGGEALEDPGSLGQKVTAAYPHTTQGSNRSNRGIPISVNCLVSFAPLRFSNLPRPPSLTKTSGWIYPAARGRFGPPTGRTSLAVSLSACHQGLGRQVGSETRTLLVAVCLQTRLDLLYV